MRSFAQQMNIPPSLISQILRGKRNLTLGNAERVVEKLSLKDKERDYFFTLVQYENSKNLKIKEVLRERLQDIRPEKKEIFDLSLDTFQMIARWYHHPIIQIFGIPGFKVSAASIAKRLGIHVSQAQEALDRLVKLEILKYEDGKYSRLQSSTYVESFVPNDALRAFHKEMLAKAIESVEEQNNTERFLGSETFCFNPEDLEDANEIMKNCFKSLVRLAAKSKSPNEVYQVGIQFFRLTKKEKHKKGER
tara:strand:+ start:236 stop:982 length:747 start_codon:yes stop_codon:yes gene_type:complete